MEAKNIKTEYERYRKKPIGAPKRIRPQGMIMGPNQEYKMKKMFCYAL